MKTLLLIALIIAIPLILLTVICFVVASLLPQKLFRINPSSGAHVHDRLTSWEEEMFGA